MSELALAVQMTTVPGWKVVPSGWRKLTRSSAICVVRIESVFCRVAVEEVIRRGRSRRRGGGTNRQVYSSKVLHAIKDENAWSVLVHVLDALEKALLDALQALIR